MKIKIFCFVFIASIAYISVGQNKIDKDREATNHASRNQYNQTNPVRTETQIRQEPTYQPQQTQINQYPGSTTIRTNNELKETRDDPRPHIHSQTNPVIVRDIKTTPEFKRATGDTINYTNAQKLKSDTMFIRNEKEKFGCCCEIYDEFSRGNKIVWCPSGPLECEKLKGKTVDGYRCSDRPK
jgi:hypothetical protein